MAETAETAEFRFFNKKHIFQKKFTATRPKYLTLQLMDIVFFAPNYSNNTTVTPVNYLGDGAGNGLDPPPPTCPNMPKHA